MVRAIIDPQRGRERPFRKRDLTKPTPETLPALAPLPGIIHNISNAASISRYAADHDADCLQGKTLFGLRIKEIVCPVLEVATRCSYRYLCPADFCLRDSRIKSQSYCLISPVVQSSECAGGFDSFLFYFYFDRLGP